MVGILVDVTSCMFDRFHIYCKTYGVLFATCSGTAVLSADFLGGRQRGAQHNQARIDSFLERLREPRIGADH